MSGYDFNHNDQYRHSAHGSHGLSNGNQASRYHAEGDYLNRNFSPAQQDMSVHNRPTSKTAMLVRQRRAMLEQLSCSLCRGYLIDATSIDDCMDSFCKSCIVTYLRTNNNCPRCGITIDRADPLSAIHSDKVLQDIVYKLVPGLYDDEMKRRRDFYRKMNWSLSSSGDDDGDSSSSSFSGIDPSINHEQHGIVSHPKPFYKPTDNIDLSIEPQTRSESSVVYYDNKRQSIVTCFTGSAQGHQQQKQQQLINSLFSVVESQQFKTYLRCPAKLTVLQLKKFIAAKFNICRDDMVHLLYLNESLKDDYSLIDIAYIYDWRGIEHMRFFYIIERDVSKVVSLSESQTNSHEHNKTLKTRQNAAISTQTVKRVCIDPQPKFYEEQRRNNIIDNNTSTNRLTRSRTEISPGASRSVVNHTVAAAKTPILRSSASSQEASTYGADRLPRQTTNGFSEREFSNYGGQRATEVQTFKSTACNVSRQEPPKDNKVPKKVTTDSTETIKRIKLNLNTSSVYERNNNTYSKVAVKDTASKKYGSGSSGSTMSHQLVPYMNKHISPSTSNTPTQSSMVTLASFTEARNNHVTSFSAGSTASALAGSYKSISNAGSSYKTSEDKLDSSRNKPIQNNTRGTSQLAFSYITERGITIVKQINNQGGISTTTTSTTSTSTMPTNSSGTNLNKMTMGSVPALMAVAPRTQQQNQSGIRSNFSSSSHQQPSNSGSSSNSHGPMASSNSSQEGPSARHLIKAKPVYKTLVDPTKVKSPNLKKLGFTARH